MSFGIISFLKSATANRGAAPVADDNPLPAYQVVGGAAVSTTNPQPVAGLGAGPVINLTRTADTNPYLAGDVVGASVAAGGAVLTFNAGGPAAGGQAIITSAQFEIDLAAIISGMTSYRLHLYNATPPGNLADNAPWDLPSGDRASYLGYLDLGTPVDVGSTLYVETNGINKQLTVPAGSVLFGYLVTNGAYTPSSGDVFKITPHLAWL